MMFKQYRRLGNRKWFQIFKNKTQCVHFCEIRQLHLDPHLTIYGRPIPVVSEAKFLGLLFDNKLSFIPHIKALKAKCLKALDILKVLSSSDWGGDRTVLLNLYRSSIQSKLDYGSIVYGSARKSYLKSLDTIHYQGLRLALGAFRTSPVESLYAEVISPNFTDSIRLPDNSSIFTAEAKAIDIALYHIRDQSEKQFIIYSDSLSVLKSLKDLHHRNPLIQQILKKYYYLSVSKEIVFCWLPSHVNIRGNELADLEAKSALSLAITNFKIPHSDFKSNNHLYINNKCQSVWEIQTQNKLNELKPNFNSKCTFSNYSRKEQTKIKKCRIGHTRITHSYILKNEQAPFCIPCNEPFTVKHFLITCSEFNYIRTKYFNVKTIKELFNDIPTQKILDFLKEIRLFNKI